jgi:hypothetical protein
MKTSNGAARASGANPDVHSGFEIQSSYPRWTVFIGETTQPARRDFRLTMVHEYFHSYQGAHYLERLVSGERPPLWLIEGSATYASYIVGTDAGWIDWEEVMVSQLDRLKDARQNYPDMALGNEDWINDGLSKSLHSYPMGLWATAFAASISKNETIMKDFWDDLKNHEWEESFLRNVGVSTEEFYSMFDEFLIEQIEAGVPGEPLPQTTVDFLESLSPEKAG